MLQLWAIDETEMRWHDLKEKISGMSNAKYTEVRWTKHKSSGSGSLQHAISEVAGVLELKAASEIPDEKEHSSSSISDASSQQSSYKKTMKHHCSTYREHESLLSDDW